MSGLAELERAVRCDLERVAYPFQPWPAPAAHSPADRYDVAIVGAGQGGLTTAFALQRERVDNVLVIEAAPPGQEGPWTTYARMHTLRTPKHVTGPDLGIPSLTFQAWYEAQYGAAAWAALGKIPRELWQAYLGWYRTVLRLPVVHETRLDRLVPEGDGFCLEVSGPEGPQQLHARKVVLAHGFEACGAWTVPPAVRDLPPDLYTHTSTPFDYAMLAGKRLGVLGAGASAFDCAATALEQGALAVDQFYRRPVLPRVNPYRWMEFAGFLKHFADLDDAWRWRFMRYIFTLNQPPTADSMQRAMAFASYRLRAGSTWEHVEAEGDGVRVETTRGSYHFDFLIVGTGFTVDLRLRPELAAFVDHIALWGDRYTPPVDEQDPLLARYPYLGRHFELIEREPGAAPYLRGLFHLTFGATLSAGLGGGSISGLKYGVPRLVAGITRQLFVDDAEHYYRSLVAYAEPELPLSIRDEV